eukprot:6208548-Pleurochrysis_carterae.AAC.1
MVSIFRHNRHHVDPSCQSDVSDRAGGRHIPSISRSRPKYSSFASRPIIYLFDPRATYISANVVAPLRIVSHALLPFCARVACVPRARSSSAL